MLIRTGRIAIAPFTLDDLDLIKQLVQDPEVVKNTRMRKPIPDERVPEVLKKWVTNATDERGMWKVTCQNTGAFIGAAMLQDTDLPYPELGYMVVQDHWGKGYATEMAKVILDYALSDLKLSRVMAGTDSDNLPSIKILSKIGMQKVTDPELLDGALCGKYFISEERD